MVFDPQSRKRRLLQMGEDITNRHRLDQAVQSLLDNGWSVSDDLDMIEHDGMQRLVVRITGLRPLFDSLAEGQIEKSAVEVVGELIEQLKHNLPEGGSELDRVLAAVPPDGTAELELLVEQVQFVEQDRRVNRWAVVVL